MAYLRPVAVSATINQTINFQSKIVLKTTGLNLTTGTPACVKSGADTCDFQIRIWSDPTSTDTTSGTGKLLFTQTFQDVEIGDNNGIFNLAMNSCGSSQSGNSEWGTSTGTCTATDDSDADSDPGVNFDRSDLWVEVSFADTDTSGSLGTFSEVFSRQPFRSVPSAFHAQEASTLSGIAPTGFVQLQPAAAQAATDTTKTLIFLNETGAGTPDLLNLQVGGTSGFLVDNSGQTSTRRLALWDATPVTTAYLSISNGTNKQTSGNLNAIDVGTITNTSTGGVTKGISSVITSGTTNAPGNLIGISGASTYASSTSSAITTEGVVGTATATGAATITNLYGGDFLATNSAATVTLIRGAQGFGANSATTNFLEGTYGSITNNASSTVNNNGFGAYGEAFNSGTVTGSLYSLGGVITNNSGGLVSTDLAGVGETVTNSSGATVSGNLLGTSNLVSNAGTVTGNTYGISSTLTNTGTTVFLIGAGGYATNSTGTVSNTIYGVDGQATNSHGTVVGTYGANLIGTTSSGATATGRTAGALLTGTNSGTTANLMGARGILTNNSSSSVTNEAGIFYGTATNSGSITNNFYGTLGNPTNSGTVGGNFAGAAGILVNSASSTVTGSIFGTDGSVNNSGSGGFLIGAFGGFTNNSAGSVTSVSASFYGNSTNNGTSPTIAGYYSLLTNGSTAVGAPTVYGMFNSVTNSGTAGFLYGTRQTVAVNSTVNNSVWGGTFEVTNAASSSQVQGVLGQAINNSGITISGILAGTNGIATNSGTTTNVEGALGQATNNSSGSTANVIGVNVFSTNAGTVSGSVYGELLTVNNNSGATLTGSVFGVSSGATNTSTTTSFLEGVLGQATNATSSTVTNQIFGVNGIAGNTGTTGYVIGAAGQGTNNSGGNATSGLYGIEGLGTNSGTVGFLTAALGNGVNNSSGTVTGALIGVDGDVSNSGAAGAGALSGIEGVLGKATNNSTGNVTGSVWGLNAIVSNTGTVSADIYGVDSQVTNVTGATTTSSNLFGYHASITNNATIANIYGEYLNFIPTTKATTGGYGIYLDTVDTGTVNNYGIYINGASGGTGTNAAIFVNGGDILATAPTTAATSQTAGTIESTNNIGQYTDSAVGVDGLPIISYYDVTNGDLRVAHCDNVACSSTTITLVDAGTAGANVGQYTSIAIGSDTFPVISYYDVTNTSLKVAKCVDVKCSGAATITTVDNTATDTGQYSSIAIGVDGFPIVSYDDATAANLNLRVAHCTTLSCSAATLSNAEATNSVGTHTSIAVPRDGLPVIVFTDVTTTDDRILKCSNLDCSAGTSTVLDNSGTSTGTFNSIMIGSDGLPIVALFDVTNANLRVAHCSNSNCTTNTQTAVDASANNVGQWSSIAMGKDGMPIISYGDATSGDLWVAHCEAQDCSGTSRLTDVESTNTVGQYTSVVVPEDGLPFIVHYDATGGNLDLRYVKCANPDCSLTAFDGLTGGSNIGSRTNFFNQVYANDYNGMSFNINNFDLAEEYDVVDTSIEAGDVVKFKNDASDNLAIERAGGDGNTYDNNVIGVISTDPGLYLKDWKASKTDGRPVALAGRVPVKVTNENGAIKRGDYLTASSKAGYAMKATSGGIIIGRAMEDFPAASSTGSTDSQLVQQKITDDQQQGQQLIDQMVQTGDIKADQTDAAKDVVTNAVVADNISQSSQVADKTVSEGRIMMFIGVGYLNDGLFAPKPTLTADDIFTTNADKTEFTMTKLLTVQSTVSATKFASIKGSDLVLQITSAGNLFKVLNSAGDSIFGVDENGKLTLKGGDNSSIGTTVVPAGQTEVQVANTSVTDKSQIHITLDQFVLNRVKDVTPGVGFTIEIGSALDSDVKINYLVIN